MLKTTVLTITQKPMKSTNRLVMQSVFMFIHCIAFIARFEPVL